MPASCCTMAGAASICSCAGIGSTGEGSGCTASSAHPFACGARKERAADFTLLMPVRPVCRIKAAPLPTKTPTCLDTLLALLHVVTSWLVADIPRLLLRIHTNPLSMRASHRRTPSVLRATNSFYSATKHLKELHKKRKTETDSLPAVWKRIFGSLKSVSVPAFRGISCQRIRCD